MDLPITPISEIDWDLVAALRTLSATLILVFLFQMAVMLSHYWHWMMPLRKEIEQDEERTLVAPPVVWTFSYHVLITLIMGLFSLGLMQNVLMESKSTVTTFVFPALIAALTLVANRFTKYYSQNLAEARRRSQFRR